MWRRLSDLALFGLLSLATLVVGHNLTFLATYGPDYGVALARTGHGAQWDDTVKSVLAAVGLLGATAALRLANLCWLVAHRTTTRMLAGLSFRAYGRVVAPLWLRLFAISIALFVVQENYERWTAGLNLPGLAVLAPSRVLGPLPVFLLVSLLVAAVAALFRWGIETLEARIAATRLAKQRVASAPGRRRARPERARGSILGSNLAGRAPPSPLRQ
jgi:hypothetical protein